MTHSHQQQPEEITLGFFEQAMFDAIRQASPEQQAELRTLARSQSVAAFTRMLQQRFAQHAKYITEERVARVIAYDQQYQARIASTPLAQAQPVPAPASQPGRITNQPAPQKGEKHGFTYHFKRSTWITALWNWFLMLASTAAEPVLTISVIYSCARLLPSIHTPVQLDNVIFICQMVALDIGGLGLRKLANQARKDRNVEGAKLAGRVSTALLTIMGINVALSVLESIAPLDPNFVKVVEGVLLIARATMAVLYAYVIHSLNGENHQGEPNDIPHPQPIATDPAMSELQASVEQLVGEQSRLRDMLRQLQETPATAPTIDHQAIISGVVAQFEGRFTAAMKRVEQDMEQRVRVSLAHGTDQRGTYGSVSHDQHGTVIAGPRLVSLPQHAVSSHPVKQPTTDEHRAVPPVQSQSDTKDSADSKSTIYALLDQDNTRQVADVVQITGLPKTTVWRHWKRYHEEHRTRGLAQVVAERSEESQPEGETA